MSKVRVEEELQASADTVWKLVSEFAGIQKWAGPMIQGIEVEGEGIGAVRKISLPGDVVFREELRAYDEGGRSQSYAIVGPSPIPVTDYLATLHIAEAGPNVCRVDWSSTFEPADVEEAKAIAIVEGVYKGGIAGIKKALGL